jgi:hypothetical protein
LIPASIRDLFTNGESSGLSFDAIGKLVFLGRGSKVDEGAVVIWAELNKDQLLQFLGPGDAVSRSVANRMVYTRETRSGAILGESEFVVGATETVDRTVETWHGEGNPISGDTLEAIDRTPAEASVRFTFESLLGLCEDDKSSSSVYESVNRCYGSIPSGGAEVRLRFEIAPSGSPSGVVAALRDDLDTVKSGGDDYDVSEQIATNLDIEYEENSVSLVYPTADAATTDRVPELLTTVVCATGLTE